MHSQKPQSPYFFFILALVLAVPAFLIYLGLLPLIPDEAIRSLVSLEMMQTGDYLTPTLGGDLYIKKPPLYNWIIALFFQVSGHQNEFVIRLPVIIFLLCYTFTIYHFVRKELGPRMGILVALMFLTNGRVLFYESEHGLIDITFSWLTYLFFMLSYHFMKREKYLALFLTAYGITAISYLMKGLPSLVFLAISLLVLFLSEKKFRMLFNWRHFAGIGLLILVVGLYYFVYFRRNEIAPESLFSTLMGETTRRTVIRFGWERTLRHLFTFPLEMFYHFLPWTLLSVLLFVRGSLKKIRKHPFLCYNALLILFNIIVYWTSPEVHPRYILMLIPPFFTILVYLYLDLKEVNNKICRWVEYILGFVLIIITVGMLVPLFIDPVKQLPMIVLVCIILLLTLALITFNYWKQASERLFWVVIALLVLRIGFDLIILPSRYYEAKEVKSREIAREVGRQTRGKPLYIWWNPHQTPDPYYGKRRTEYAFMFYISVERQQPLTFSSEIDRKALYIAREEDIEGYIVDTLWKIAPPDHQGMLYLIAFREAEKP
ncbi:MAG: glycosyltransferase family 39 protein [Bacteroidales bacterium]|nr:glycosyltransferase family 39 protein [Lentimicrobiaceae bacterium]MDD5695466.1 glycosyltransferase family 39 protein [Bacteroidales bacterium]